MIMGIGFLLSLFAFFIIGWAMGEYRGFLKGFAKGKELEATRSASKVATAYEEGRGAGIKELGETTLKIIRGHNARL